MEDELEEEMEEEIEEEMEEEEEMGEEVREEEKLQTPTSVLMNYKGSTVLLLRGSKRKPTKPRSGALKRLTEL